MKRKLIVAAMLVLGLAAGGCSGWFWGGAAVGATGAGAAYEYSNKQQLDELEEDYANGEITKEEYDRRKEEIQGRSLVY